MVNISPSFTIVKNKISLFTPSVTGEGLQQINHIILESYAISFILPLLAVFMNGSGRWYILISLPDECFQAGDIICQTGDIFRYRTPDEQSRDPIVLHFINETGARQTRNFQIWSQQVPVSPNKAAARQDVNTDYGSIALFYFNDDAIILIDTTLKPCQMN